MYRRRNYRRPFTRRSSRYRNKRRRGFRRRFRSRKPIYIKIRPEVKYQYTILTKSGADFDSTFGAGHFTYLSSLDQGTTIEDRIGQKATLTSIQVKSIIIPNIVTETTQANLNANHPMGYRIIIGIQKHRCNVAPTIDDLLHDATASETSYTNFMTSMKNPETIQNYRILYDKTFIPAFPKIFDESTDTNMLLVPYKPYKLNFYKKFKKPLVQEYSATTGGSITDNSIFMWCGSTVASGEAPRMYGYAKVKFIDC